jgi:hypothetical protein
MNYQLDIGIADMGARVPRHVDEAGPLPVHAGGNRFERLRQHGDVCLAVNKIREPV